MAIQPDKEQQSQPIREIDVLWITAGLGCDGDTISVTAATQPSIEDLVLGALPGLPKVNLHNPVLAFEVGDDFLKYFHRAAEGKLDPFILVVEGSIPNENLIRKGIGQPSAQIHKRDNPSQRASGSIVWFPTPGPSLRLGPARRTAGFMRWREIPRGAWACQTIWVGNGSRRRKFP